MGVFEWWTLYSFSSESILHFEDLEGRAPKCASFIEVQSVSTFIILVDLIIRWGQSYAWALGSLWDKVGEIY